MKRLLLLLTLAACTLHAESPPPVGKTVPLFDGKTLDQWEGDPKFWRVEDGCLTGGSLKETTPHNDFLASTKDFTNFIVRFKIKLTGTEGFINSGFQIRSQRAKGDPEMVGYQCDYGEPNWYGCVYDESRRNKVMSPSDMKALDPVIKRQDWNEYIIRADGPRITTWINGVQGTDYTEADAKIPDFGKFGIQIHGGGKVLVQVKDISIEELPAKPKFVPAPEPKKGAKASPLLPEEERATFTLPPGFELELVAQEDVAAGIGKFITVDWDQHGRMWSMTALEYPVDGNENAAQAKALYENPGRDKVIVFDTPFAPGVQKPRVFAEGLAIPEGLLPYKDGCYVQHGPAIEFLRDTDGDGKADKKEVILSGFGVQDSHLFPHQFTRAPGNWIWMAQGAFNYGTVKTTTGKETKFDQTRMAKFRYDGSDFDITSQGPCNIWGLVITGEGEAWIQEANDYGFPVMPFHEYANYPGCSDSQFKSYAPEFPGTAPDFQMGGTGLSGLALSDKTGAFPEAYADVMFVANPITRKIQAIKITPDGPRFTYRLLGDFVNSSDEWFRPVSIHFGPDGCLYIVDWYNKIISHNEVPRNHPDRDKTRGRIWRVKATAQTPHAVPDFTKLSGDQLTAKLGGESLSQSHFAWQTMIDRQDESLVPKLRAIVDDPAKTASARIGALWTVEGYHKVDAALLKPLLTDANRNVRREGVRAYGEAHLADVLAAIAPLVADPDPVVRAQVIRTAGWLISRPWSGTKVETPDANALALLMKVACEPLAEPKAPATRNGQPIKVREAYEREFERYLVRLFLEQQPQAVTAFLDSEGAKTLPVESRLLASLALEPKSSAARVAQLLPKLTRPPGQEEVLRLAQFLDEPGVGDALKATLANPATRNAVLEALLATRTRLDAAKLTPLLADAAKSLLAGDDAARALALRLAAGFQLSALEPDLVAVLNSAAPVDRQLAALGALREMGSSQAELFAKFAKESKNPLVRDEALNALAASKSDQAGKLLLAMWPELSAVQRRNALDRLTASKAGAQTVVAAVKSGAIAKTDLDGPAIEKLQIVLGNDADLAALMNELASLFRPVLTLNGSDDAWCETGLSLNGPFTVETWVLLNPKGRAIGNDDGILGSPGQLDMNFYGSIFRVWVGGTINDAIVAKKPIVPGLWTHIAVSRDEKGAFKIYQDGMLDQDQGTPVPWKFDNVRIAWTGAPRGTAGAISEFRIWNRVRTAEEISREFDRSYEGVPKPADLVYYSPGGGPWGKLQPGAKIAKTSDLPPLLTAEEAKALDAKFDKYRALANQPGTPEKGKAITVLCRACHLINGEGGIIGPNISGAGAMGVEALLRRLITPNAAMESAYHVYRVEMRDGSVREGFRASEDKDAVVLRTPGAQDQRIARPEIRETKFLRRGMMPEGLLDTMTPEQVSDLFAYLKTLK